VNLQHRNALLPVVFGYSGSSVILIEVRAVDEIGEIGIKVASRDRSARIQSSVTGRRRRRIKIADTIDSPSTCRRETCREGRRWKGENVWPRDGTLTYIRTYVENAETHVVVVVGWALVS